MLAGTMTRTVASVLFLAATLVAVAACSDQGAVKTDAPGPAVAPAATLPPLVSARSGGTAPLPAVPEGAGVGEAALAWTVPASWIEERPASPMRRAQYRVPGKAGDGECAVFYFGPGQGGDPMSNALRWADQFSLPDGSPARGTMKTSEIEAGGLKVLVVEVAGTYKGGMTMTAAPATPKPGYRLLGAVAPGPDANWFFKLTGPDATVNEQRGAFTSMVSSLTHGASESK